VHSTNPDQAIAARSGKRAGSWLGPRRGPHKRRIDGTRDHPV